MKNTISVVILIFTDYLANRDGNVILVDARYLFAGPWYITSSANVQVVGEYTAKFIDYLVDNGLKLADLHLVGMSLGGQTVGVIGSNLKSGKARRVTGWTLIFNYWLIFCKNFPK